LAQPGELTGHMPPKRGIVAQVRARKNQPIAVVVVSVALIAAGIVIQAEGIVGTHAYIPPQMHIPLAVVRLS
jgi:hypothetical protein